MLYLIESESLQVALDWQCQKQYGTPVKCFFKGCVRQERSAIFRDRSRQPHCVLSDLLDEERGSGRRRPVAGPVDCDERDRIIASLGGV